MSSELTSRWFETISRESNIPLKSVAAVADLLDQDATIPFIARYRKEQSGNLNEQQISLIRDRLNQLRELDKRREAIISSLEKQGKLTSDLIGAIINATSISELEDIYLPYRPKRKTRASVAREKGLEPLAQALLIQGPEDPLTLAASFIKPDLEVHTTEDALAGARDIIAEIVAEDIICRKEVRTIFREKGLVTTRVIRGKEQDGQKFKDYFDWKEPLAKIPSHRMLAIRRGEKEEILSFNIEPPVEDVLEVIKNKYVKSGPSSSHVALAIEDSYTRLLKPSIETEIRIESKMKADEEAIKVFSDNLRKLLLSAPLGQKNILAIDPGFRSGCKVVCLDRQGKLLHETVIYPNEPKKNKAESSDTIKKLCEEFRIDAIAIGNGTAGRETESFVRSIGLSQRIQIVVVNESGASVYSASEAAREEFPDKDITVRGAVSIGRRLMDPLSELVKIDSKSIGVGQYQHDVDQHQLKQGLDDIVISCVNAVGVEVNTASRELLSYVSGIGPSLAKNIIDHRNANGPFKDRTALMEVNRFGEKVFEQSAGFLRIREGNHPLDVSAVHPESYPVVDQIAKDLGCSINELIGSVDLRNKIDLKNYVSEKTGLLTLEDIMNELEKPGRDPRDHFDPVVFSDDVHKLEDLKIGMKLPGIVTNVTAFGAFVDIGVHQDGLVHISHLSDQFVKDAAAVVSVQKKVEVTVIELDIERKRIGLSMKSNPFASSPPKPLSENRPGKKPAGKQGQHRKTDQRTQHPGQSMEEKLAQLLNKYKK